MSPDQRFAIIITGISALFVILCTVLGLIWRTGNKTGETLQVVKRSVEDIKQVTDDLDRHIQWHINKERR